MACTTVCPTGVSVNAQSTRRALQIVTPLVRINGQIRELPANMRIPAGAVAVDENSANEVKVISGNVTINAANAAEYRDRKWEVTAAATITISGTGLNLGNVLVRDAGKNATIAVAAGANVNGGTASVVRTGHPERIFSIAQFGADNYEVSVS